MQCSCAEGLHFIVLFNDSGSCSLQPVHMDVVVVYRVYHKRVQYPCYYNGHSSFDRCSSDLNSFAQTI